MGFRADVRAAAVTLLEGYKAASGIKLQIYPGRPATIQPPTGFVDAVNEGSITWTQGPTLRSPVAEIILIQGVFDSKDATEQQDALVDGFLAYVRANFSAAGAGTLVTVTSIQDIPAYIPDWFENPPVFYATRLALEGLKAEAGLV